MSHDRRKETADLIAGGISESKLALKMKFWFNTSDKLALDWAKGAIHMHSISEEKRIKEEEPEKNDKQDNGISVTLADLERAGHPFPTHRIPPVPTIPVIPPSLPPMPIMADPIISPDGKFMWTGTEWIPAPPSSSPATNVSLQEDEELENDKLTFIEMEDIDEETIAETEYFLRAGNSLKMIAYFLRCDNIHITKEESLEIVKKIDNNLRQKPWGGDGNEVQDDSSD